MDDYAENAGRLLADRYRLPQPVADTHQLTESVAYDTASGQEVLVRQVPLPEVVEAEVLDAGGEGGGAAHQGAVRGSIGRATRRPADPVVRRAVDAAVAAASLPDHPRLDQVFDVFVEGDGLWIVSELLPATPLAALLAHQTLTAHRAAEVAADVLTALRVVHAHGWTHRNVTPRTVLICDDGRALLTGLAVGAAEEALCGYNPQPDAGRVALPPSGSIPGEARPGGGSADPGRGTDGSGAAASGPGPGPGDTFRRSGRPPDLSGAAAPEPWSDISLPDGFAARQDDDPYGPGSGYGPGSYGSGGLSHEPGLEQGPGLDHGPGADAGSGRGPRGIFGLQGLGQNSRDAGEEDVPPVRHGYETGGRARPGSAIAAYQAGARRGAASRIHGRDPDEEQREHGLRPEQPGSQESADSAARRDWWNSTASAPPAAGPHTTPDDFVRWLPSGEDEVTPSDLPGARVPDSRPVKANWRPRLAPDPDPDTASPQDGGDSGEFGEGGVNGPYAEGESGAAAENPAADAADAADAEAYPDAGVYADDDACIDGAYGEESRTPPWGGAAEGSAGGFHGPASALQAERARQARMTVVGAVSERWAPEQAGPVHQNWRLAPPVGPAADLWALGVLLFRAVQGHAPYPEDDVAELVQMVCGEPPAFAEECGVLRPVVESLLRQDPTERPDFEELRGWLRSLVRAAPEPEPGWHTVYAPPLDAGGVSDPRRLPILRRRGELVRRRRARRAARAEQRRQYKQQKQQQKQQKQRDQQQRRQRMQAAQVQPPAPAAYSEQAPPGGHTAAPPKPRRAPRQRAERRPREPRQGTGPRSLGRVLVGLVLAGLAAAMAYAVWFMPESGSGGAANQQRGSVGGESPQPGVDGGAQGGAVGDGGDGGGGTDGKRPSEPAAEVPRGYKLSRDPAGFQVAVPQEWDRRSTPGRGQVRYNGGGVEMVLVNGRDSVRKFGNDPMAYQSDDEAELKAYRASDWASTSGLRRIDVGETAMAEGTFSWKDAGRDVYARNRAMIHDGRYHVLMVMGSKNKKQEIDRHFEAVADTYRPTGR